MARVCRFNLTSRFSTVLCGYLVVEFLALILAQIAGMLLGASRWHLWLSSALLAVPLSAFDIARGGRDTATSLLSKIESFTQARRAELLTSLLLVAGYFTFMWDHVRAGIRSEGVIYQDVIWHMGVSRSIAEFGLPVSDLQYADERLHYHIFTHAVSAKIEALSGWGLAAIWLIGLPVLLAIAYAFVSVSLLRAFDARIKVQVAISVLACTAALFLGGAWATAGLKGFLFYSYSYPLQLVVVILILDYMHSGLLFDDARLTRTSAINIGVLIGLATVAKGSSLPVLLAAVAAWFALSWWGRLRSAWRDLDLLALMGAPGLAVLPLFYLGSNRDTGFGLNRWIADRALVGQFERFDLELPLAIELTVLCATAISFRLLLLHRSCRTNRMAAFATGAMAGGLVLFLFANDSPMWYLLAALFIANFVTLIMFVRAAPVLPRYTKVWFVALLILSLYPLGSIREPDLGEFLDKKRETYLPLSEERVELYAWIDANVDRREVIFTTSVIGTSTADVEGRYPFGVPDNYYPAALSGRKFFLGGYRVNQLANQPDFDARLELVQNFSLADRGALDQLLGRSIQWVLIESTGNFQPVLEDLDNSLGEYEVAHRNPAGIVLRIGTP